MNMKIMILPITLMLLMSMVLGATCIYYTTTTETDGADFFGVLANTTNTTTTIGADSKFLAYTAFTPRLNFSMVVREIIVGQAENGNNTLGWKYLLNASPTLAIYNGSGLIAANNYTVLQNFTTGMIRINWGNGNYSGQDLTLNFTRNFTKNVDDLVISPSSIYTATSESNWLVTTVPTAYGEQSTFRLNNVSLGNSTLGQNWAVEWTKTNRTCASYTTDAATVSGVGNTKNLVYAGLSLLAVMILVTIAWGLIQIFRGGDVDFMTVTIAAIGGAVLIMLGFIIIYFVGAGLGV